MKRFLKFLGVLVLAIVALGVFATFHVPGHLWIKTRTFADCPARPSCVSSAAADEVHRIEPLAYAGDLAAARTRMEALLRAMPRVTIEDATPEYLHAVFQTEKMHFHDDVELLFEPGGKIQVRSISRFGYRDHGVNRARVEELRAMWQALQGV
ncbi:MAG TPA: DUF1499 domain-containing protein [Solimonas sp.]|nr:DUF1499 domain-containing protein [Solimonas sp.]